MIVNRTAEEFEGVIKEELWSRGPLWQPEVIKSLGVVSPFLHNGGVSFDTLDEIERAAIRMTFMCLSFEKALDLEQGTMLDYMAGIYTNVARNAEIQHAAQTLTWQDHGKA